MEGTPAPPAVLIVHDTLGLDRRSRSYIARLNAAGIAVLEVELRANPLDGAPEPLPGESEAAELVTRTVAVLTRDPRVNPTRIGGLGFGIGARAVALAPAWDDGHRSFAARLLLYPGCASLAELLSAPQASRATPSPVLILHGGDDPANPPTACGALAAAFGPTESVRRISYEGATYAWDLPQSGGSPATAQPWPRESGTVPAHSCPELAELSAAQAAEFFAAALHGTGRDAEMMPVSFR
ncbi:dienelactone hydrolase family protein [Sabulicella rubraurantiaca]|uniref:dienelactone hydrolase family protein n=1 Tax=Sabulicella rubraurantiaca TaxID=2811429 RepID=UPI001A96D430|nr:hypothetical protein [Sabulicella rubraurantiaca]